MCPMLRTLAPTRCATPAQVPWIARHTWAIRAANIRASGPGPLRTALGAGRFLDFLVWLVLRLVEDFGDPPPDDRVLDAAALFALLLERVLLPRDAGGEDVRVAMLRD